MYYRIISILLLIILSMILLGSCLSIPSDLDLNSYSPSPTTNTGLNVNSYLPENTPDTEHPEPTRTLAIYRLGEVMLADEESRLYVREGPGENYKAVGALCDGVIVRVFSEEVKGWDQIEFNGALYYAASKFIVKNKSLTDPGNEKYYYMVTQQEHVEICTLPPAMIASNEAVSGQELDIDGDGNPEGTAVDSDGDMVAESLEYRVIDSLVDIQYYLPSIEFDLVLSSENNPAGKPIYQLPSAFLQKDAMTWLRKAQAIFLEDGYCIRLYDAYRPLSTHQLLCEAVGTPYLDQSETSPHCRGASVDITLVDLETGSPVDMPCTIYDFGEAAYRDYSKMSDKERENIKYIESVMERCGYIPDNEFWWQYDFSLFKDFMATDHDIDGLMLIRES